MSKDVKVILIVFGSLAALVVVAVVGFVTFVMLSVSHHVGPGSERANAESAAKIAKFVLPPGYHYEMAMDMAFMNMVMISPNAHRGFTIQLQGIATVPAGSSDEQLSQSMLQGYGAGGGCRSKTELGNDTIKTASGSVVTLHVLHCNAAAGPGRDIEFGRIPSSYPLALILASGAPQTFDRDALHALVRSIR